MAAPHSRSSLQPLHISIRYLASLSYFTPRSEFTEARQTACDAIIRLTPSKFPANKSRWISPPFLYHHQQQQEHVDRTTTNLMQPHFKALKDSMQVFFSIKADLGGVIHNRSFFSVCLFFLGGGVFFFFWPPFPAPSRAAYNPNRFVARFTCFHYFS